MNTDPNNQDQHSPVASVTDAHPLDPLLALSEKATPGPFTVEDADGDGSVYFICVQHHEVGTVSVAETRAGCDEASEMGGNPEANALFLVAAANYVRANVKALASTATELPELPTPCRAYQVDSTMRYTEDDYFTADQMRAYAESHAPYWKEMHRAANARGDGTWLPIESAPKGREVLVWRADAGAFLALLTDPASIMSDEDVERIGFPDYYEEWFSFAYGWQEGSERPTHWMEKPCGPGSEVRP